MTLDSVRKREAVQCALVAAVMNDNVAEVEAILDRNVNITPLENILETAIQHKRPKVVRFLIDIGVDVNKALPGSARTTPLMRASLWNYADIVALLIENGADVNGQNARGWTALMFSVQGAAPETMRLLLDNGANTALRNDEGHTAQDIAATGHKLRMIEILQQGRETRRKHAEAEAVKSAHDLAADKQRKLNARAYKPVIKGLRP